MNKEVLIKNLIDCKAIVLSPNKLFTWSSGIKSPIYTDNRLIYSYPEYLNNFIDAFIEKIKELKKVDRIIGIATSGIGFGAIIANKLSLPFSYVRSSQKNHGKEKMIEGEIFPNEHVVVIEDLISKGNSSLKGCLEIKKEGAQVESVISIFSYNLPVAQKVFAENKIATISLITINDILNSDYFKSEFSEKDKTLINNFLSSLN